MSICAQWELLKFAPATVPVRVPVADSASKGALLPVSAAIPPGQRHIANLTPLAAAIFAVLYPAHYAAAQDESRIEEIIVTATKREMNMQDLGQSITALTTVDIKKLAIQNTEDYVRALTSVSLANAVPGRNTIVMRGMSTGTQEFYTDSQVAVYLDEQPITTISQEVDVRMIDINRVEVLPGPQGTLFGSSSQSGTLRIITNQPDPTAFSSEIDAGVWTTDGGEESYDLSGWINVPVSDTLAIRAVAFTAHEGGYVDNVLGATLEGSETNADVAEEDQNAYDNYGGRIAALWNISEEWGLNLSYIAQQSELEGAWETDPAIGDFKITRFFDEYRDDDWYQVSGTVKGDLGFAELTATASYFDRKVVYEWDNMVYEQWKDSYFAAYPLYNSDYTFGTIFNDQDIYRAAYEARLTSQGESRFHWMIGAFYEDSTTEWFYGAKNPDYVGTTSWYAAQAYAYYYNYLGYDVQYPLLPTDIAYSESYYNDIKQTAVFGEIGFDLTEQWNVTVGARWFEFDRNTVTIYQFPQGLPPFTSFDTGGRVESSGVESDTVFKLGTTFHFTDDVMAYALYSEGFRLGGTNSQRAANTGLIPPVYEPDKVQNYEAGIKSQFADGRVLLNVIAFSAVWDQIQVTQFSVNGIWWLQGIINGGEAENQGVEISAEWQATDNLNLVARATISDPQFKEDIDLLGDDTDNIDEDVHPGDPLVWSAEEKYYAAVEYVVPDVLGGDLWFRYDYSYEGEKWNTLSNIVENDPEGLVPSWSLSNFHVGLTMENGWELQADVKNVWNELAYNSLDNDSSGDLFGDPRFDNIRNYARPRTIGFSVRKRFD
jgi:outer membrane receptor protein involved in Fe transport